MMLKGSSKALVALLSGFLLAITSGVVDAQFSSNVVALTARNWRQEVEGTRYRHVMFIPDSSQVLWNVILTFSSLNILTTDLSIYQSLHTRCLSIFADKDEATANF
jgi:hypothetical protein